MGELHKGSAFYNWKNGSDSSPSFISKGLLPIGSFPAAEKLYQDMSCL